MRINPWFVVAVLVGLGLWYLIFAVIRLLFFGHL
jgi:hypothetical protein